MLKLRRPAPRPRRALSRAEAEQLLTREDIGLRERTLWRMLYELLAQPSRRHHAAGAVRVLAQSLIGTPDQRPGCCLCRRGTFSQAELTAGDNPLYHLLLVAAAAGAPV